MARKSASSAAYVTRREFSEIVRELKERHRLIEDLQDSSAIQFKRIAQLQVQLDEIRAAWVKMALPKR